MLVGLFFLTVWYSLKCTYAVILLQSELYSHFDADQLVISLWLLQCSHCVISLGLAPERLPWWVAVGHRHAPEQGNSGAGCVLISESWLSTLSVTAHKDIILCTWRIPLAARRRTTGPLLCLLRLHGGSQGRHGTCYPGLVAQIFTYGV